MSARHFENIVPEDPLKTGSYKWFVFGLFILVNTFGFFVANTIGILLPSISADLNLSPTQQGVLSSAPYWANVVLMVIIALWASQFAPKLLTLVTVVLGAILILLQAWAQTFTAIFTARLLFGITMIAREPARALLIKQWIPQQQVNQAGGFANLFFGIMVSGGVLLIPVLLDYFDGNWRSVMVTFASIFFAMAFIWGILGKENPVNNEESIKKPNELQILRQVIKFKEVWFAGIGFMGALMSFASFNTFLPTLFVDFYDISLSKSGLIIALYILPGGFSGLILGLLSKSSRSRSGILMVSGTVISMSFLSMTLIDSYQLLIGIAIINGIAWGFFPLLFMVPFHIKNIRPREIAVSSATVMTMAAVGSSIGPTLTGFLQESLGSLETSLRFMAFSPLSLFIAGFLLRKTPQSN